MGYDTTIKECLQKKGYEVTLMNNEYLLPYMNPYVKSRFYYRIVRRLGLDSFSNQIQKELSKFYSKKPLKLGEYYDIALCINGQYLPIEFYGQLKEIAKTRILYFWDDTKKLASINHSCFFDRVYSYNIDDCQKYNWKYLPMFTQIKGMEQSYSKKYDISLIGSAHHNRVQFAKRLLSKYGDKYNIFVYLVGINKSENERFIYSDPLGYDEYLKILKQSKCTIDLPFTGQEGPTTRFEDALLAETKVITTNKNIEKYPFFNQNICITDSDDIMINTQFIEGPYVDAGMKPTDVETWLKELGL